MSRAWTDKDPDAVRRYSMDLVDLIPSGEALLTAEFSSVPSGLSFSGASVSSTEASALISGGTSGTNYRVTCRFSTDGDTVDDATLPLFVISR